MELARNRTGRRESREQQEARQRRPRERGSCYILERRSGKFEQRCESEQEKSVNRAGEYGTGNLCRDCRFSLVLYNYVIHKNHTV